MDVYIVTKNGIKRIVTSDTYVSLGYVPIPSSDPSFGYGGILNIKSRGPVYIRSNTKLLRDYTFNHNGYNTWVPYENLLILLSTEDPDILHQKGIIPKYIDQATLDVVDNEATSLSDFTVYPY